MSEDEKKIQDIFKKIEREKNIINAAQAMRSQTTNETVRSRLETQLRDGRRNLQFFEEKLRDIQVRQAGQGVENMSLGAAGGSGGGVGADDNGSAPLPPSKDSAASWAGDQGGYGTAPYSQIGQHGDLMPPRHPYAPQEPGAGIPKARPNFTKLGWSNPVPRMTTGRCLLPSVFCFAMQDHAMFAISNAAVHPYTKSWRPPPSRLDQIRYAVPWPSHSTDAVPDSVQAQRGGAIPQGCGKNGSAVRNGRRQAEQSGGSRSQGGEQTENRAPEAGSQEI